MANEATERFLQNAPRIIVFAVSFFLGFILSIEIVEIDGQNIPVSFEDFPEVFVCALILFLIAYQTGFCSVISFEENRFITFLRWCCIVSFALAVCLLFTCRLLSSLALIGSDSGWTYEEL
ncbi:hypothetical protein Tco_1126806 [Tanacetum coccineum]